MTNSTSEWLATQAAQRREKDLVRTLRPRAAESNVLDLASNDYLGLSRDTRVIEAALAATREWGTGTTGSRLVTGTTELHAALDRDLAAFVGAPVALAFSSGYLANLGAITSLASSDTTIISDSLNHASLIDAIRLSRARAVIVDHRDVSAVAAALRDRTTKRALVVTDAVFSVDGDAAPLAELHDLCEQHDATLIVDEAHSLGVVGIWGRGGCDEAGIADSERVVMTVTFSKSLGTQGGAVVGHPNVIAHLIDSARSFIFDTGLAPSCVAAARESLSIIRSTPELVAAVNKNARTLQSFGRDCGFPSNDSSSAVISLQVPTAALAVEAARICLEQGVHVGCFRPPSVPDGLSRLRLTARATLTDSDLRRAQNALDLAGQIIAAPSKETR